MAREEFFDNVRLAFGLILPAVADESPSLDSVDLERVQQRAGLWLIPKSVEGFDPPDFEELAPGARAALTTAVQEFRRVAQQVSANGREAREQLRLAWASFRQILAIVQQLVRDEWVREVDHLATEAEAWCRRANWLASKKVKKLKDRFLGELAITQLQIYALGCHLLLDPVARYVPGASGLVDLAVLPSFEAARITRTGGKWYIHPVQDGGRRRKWSERAFVDTVNQLSVRA